MRIMNNEGNTPVILNIRARSQEQELVRLNRLTGLTFDSVPTALIGKVGGLELAQEDGEELIFRALYLWDE